MIPPETLSGLCFLQGLADEHLQHLAALAVVKDVPAGAVVFREGEASTHVYLPLEGRVALEIRGPRGMVRLHTVGTGELLGWSPLLGPAGPMTATARALGPCRLLALHAPQLLALAEHNPKLGMELLRRTALALARRLDATRLHLLDVFRDDLTVVTDQGGTT
jgi:CRP-like cAMP-binding protein